MLQAELKILGGKHQGKAIPLSTKKFLVGREQDCQLRPNSDLVSRHHCVFTIDDYAVRLRDLGSTNGTRVNGKPLHGEVTLKAGDQIGIGKLELELVVRQRVAVPAAEATAPLSGLSSGEMDIASITGTVEIPANFAETAQLTSETTFEMPATFAPPTDETSTTLAADTTIIPGSIPAPFPGYAPMPAAGYPAAYPPGYPGAPGYAPPGYPAQPMGYPAQPMYPGQYPGYPPQGYPAMPGYPMQQMPYAGAYPAPAVQQAPPLAADAAAVAVKLPPPESTGVKAPAPAPAAAPDASGVAPKTEEKPSNTAADIIKSYMQKRNR